jgi:flavodoxin
MKSIIIYYSFTGNTKKVSQALGEHLKLKGEVEYLELKPKDESKNFFAQCSRAFWRKRAQDSGQNFDFSKFDFICFGTPVWAFGPAPAMNTCLDNCLGAECKRIILFTTYGSGTGNDRCLDYMEEILRNKGAQDFKRFSIPQFKVKDRKFVLSEIEKVARLAP